MFALLIIVGGVLALLMTAGFIMWLMTSMRGGAIRSTDRPYPDRPPGLRGGGADPYRYLLQDDAKADNEIRRSPHVEEVTPGSRSTVSAQFQRFERHVRGGAVSIRWGQAGQ